MLDEPQPRFNGPVLVVDDDPDIRESVADVLSSEGYRVTTANDGLDALGALAVDPPSLVLLDMRMPRLDGWGFAAELRRRGLAVPVVVMTAARDARAWAAEIEAQGFISKPFLITELLAVVERHRRSA